MTSTTASIFYRNRIEELEDSRSDHTDQLNRANLLYTRFDEIERDFTKSIEEIKIDINSINHKVNDDSHKISKMNTEVRMIDDKISKIVGNVNHTRETFLDLKTQIYREITTLKEGFYAQFHELGEGQRETKEKQETCILQVENHKLLLNDLDSVLEKINLDMTHKFNLTIKSLQEEKVDKKDFDNRFAYLNKIVNECKSETDDLTQRNIGIKTDLYKLIHTNTQIELYNMMNAVFKDGTDEKENMRNYLQQNFNNVTKTKTVTRKVLVKKKVENSPQKNEISVTDTKPKEDSDSEYKEEEVEEEFHQELDFHEITQQLTDKFMHIKILNFDCSNDRGKKEEEKRKANFELMK